MSPALEGTCTVSQNVLSGLTVSMWSDAYTLFSRQLQQQSYFIFVCLDQQHVRKFTRKCSLHWGISCEKMRLNTPGLRHNERHFEDDILKYFFLNENVWIAIKTSLMFVSRGPINNIPALVQIMASCLLNCWRMYASFGLNELIHSSRFNVIIPVQQGLSASMLFLCLRL